MAGIGPPPKTSGVGHGKVAAANAIEKRTISQDNELRGPPLPNDVLPDGEEWHPRTKQWWGTWRLSAQAQEFTDTDWDFLLDTALMHTTMWTKGRWEFAAELRLRAAKFGATPEDRMRLRLTVKTAADVEKDRQPPATPGDVASRRRGLTIAG